MIPKIIHYVWIGPNPKPAAVLRCIESWRRFCPEYEIREWGNKDLSYIKNDYVEQALKCKKWAFVSDYIRLYALNKYGGIYCDTDLELTANLDCFLNNDFFMGYEMDRKHPSYSTALIGSKANHPIINDLLQEYKNRPFLINGIPDLTPNPVRFERYFKEKFGISVPKNVDKMQSIKPNSYIYPSYFFCLPKPNCKNYAIHHFQASWCDAFRPRIKAKIRLGSKIFYLIKVHHKRGHGVLKLPQNIHILFLGNKNKKSFWILGYERVSQ